EGERVVRRQDGDLLARAHAVVDQRGRDPAAEVLHLGVRPGLAVGRQTGRVWSEGRALVEVVGETHAQPSTVSTGSETRPKLRSTPSSSRCPNAWQPEAKPTRRGGCCSREYAAYACSAPVCL